MQRNLLLPLAVLLLSAPALFAQMRTADPAPVRHRSIALPAAPDAATFRATMDTLLPPSFDDPCIEAGVVVFVVDDVWGFVPGMNGYLDKEKAQYFQFTGSAMYTISEVWGYFAEATAVQDGELSFKLYSVDEQTGAPATLLGTSATLNVSELVLGEEVVDPTPFIFEMPVAIESDEFFVSCDLSALYATEDTVSLFMTEDMCGDGATSWELYANDSWNSMVDGWGLNADWAIAAIVEFEEPTDIDDPYIAHRDLVLYPAFPNPAGAEIQLRYELQEGSRVRIELYSADGRLLRRSEEGLLPAGPHQHVVATDRLEAGAYVYAIITDQGRLMSRFVVQ